MTTSSMHMFRFVPRRAIAPRARLAADPPRDGIVRTAKRGLRRVLALAVAKLAPRAIFTDPQNFSLWERRGFHILPATFYSPVPNLAELSRRSVPRCSVMPGVDMGDERQERLLRELDSLALRERDDLCEALEASGVTTTGYTGADMMIYYSLLRRLRPARIIEVGAGTSTFIAGYALHRNAAEGDGAPADFTSIDPYPHPTLSDRVPCLSRMLAMPVQDVPSAEFERLREGDILFIDSTHVCKLGSDVNYLILEILPRLHPGVWVHFHDIFLPREYPDAWWQSLSHRFWNEQYLLHAFLAFNSGYEVMLAANDAQHRRAGAHAALFENGSADHVPGSFWIRRTGDATGGGDGSLSA